MSFFSFLLLFLVTIICLFWFFILSLNTNLVGLDFIFFELDISLGLIILISFLIGCLLTIALEIIYFIKKKSNKKE